MEKQVNIGLNYLSRSSALMAIVLSAFVWAVSSVPAAAQTSNDPSVQPTAGTNIPCYTQVFYDLKKAKSGHDAASCPGEGPCDDPAVRDSWIPGPTDPPIVINTFFHVFRNDDGSNAAATEGNVATVIAAMNSHFAPWKIEFVYDMQFVNSSAFRVITTNGEFDAMKNQYAINPDSQCNIYVVDVNVGGDVFSFATFPWDTDALSPRGGIVMNRTQFPPFDATVLTHEMGHCLGLWHTHHGVDEVSQCGGCYEVPTAGNRDVTGDFCSDTDPTPTNFGCGGPGGNDPCSGIPWGATDPQNFMGYGPEFCVTEFTSQQSGRMQCWTDEVLTSWLNNVQFQADTAIGPVPLDVTFTAQTAKSVLNWYWDFGDGDSAFIQNPSHLYDMPGVFDVKVSINATDGVYDTFREDYIFVHADTVIGQKVTGNPGDQVRVDVYARNFLPLSFIQIPFSWSGPLMLTWDSVSTVGLRTDYLPSKSLKNFDPFNARATYQLKSLGSPPIAPDTGAILSLWFTIPSGAPDDSTAIVLDTWSSNNLEFVTDAGLYYPVNIYGQIALDECLPGDIDNSGSGPDVADLTYFVNYFFKAGPAPVVIETGNCDGIGGIDIADLTYFVNFSFKGGPAPVCAPVP